MIFVFSWLVTYQLCDATEDFIEDANASASMAAFKQGAFTTPARADDVEISVPQVQDQAIVSAAPAVHPQFVSESIHSNEHLVLLALIPQTISDHSPPGRTSGAPALIGHTNEPYVASAQSLAPPAA